MVSQKEKDIVIKSMMENFPEASSSSLICTYFNYKNMVFDFVEDDEKTDSGIKHRVDMTSLRKGFDILITLALNGEYKNYNFPIGIFGKNPDFDATDCDALVQCAIFGKIIYG